jgi:hypothetical protein
MGVSQYAGNCYARVYYMCGRVHTLHACRVDEAPLLAFARLPGCCIASTLAMHHNLLRQRISS